VASASAGFAAIAFVAAVAGTTDALVCLSEDKKDEPLTLYVPTPLVPSG
jgi:hypothetical protein